MERSKETVPGAVIAGRGRQAVGGYGCQSLGYGIDRQETGQVAFESISRKITGRQKEKH